MTGKVAYEDAEYCFTEEDISAIALNAKIPYWFDLTSEERTELYCNDSEKHYYVHKFLNCGFSPSSSKVPLLIFINCDYFNNKSCYNINLKTMKPTQTSPIQIRIPEDIKAKVRKVKK